MKHRLTLLGLGTLSFLAFILGIFTFPIQGITYILFGWTLFKVSDDLMMKLIYKDIEYLKSKQ